MFDRLEASASSVLNELVHKEDKKSFPISRLSKVWESGLIKGRILEHLKALWRLECRERTLEEAAR